MCFKEHFAAISAYLGLKIIKLKRDTEGGWERERGRERGAERESEREMEGEGEAERQRERELVS